ncbi:unnamed protein product [Nesidiocoris tenuis]|uniref:Uncharacterized protein n=1 Tax=Nesidiocoris tenuis TaxID=355587 RepID=A0A6H5HFM9_9HEMI|nr:unnamed protein product [Nesidiocoris tenuis]
MDHQIFDSMLPEEMEEVELNSKEYPGAEERINQNPIIRRTELLDRIDENDSVSLSSCACVPRNMHSPFLETDERSNSEIRAGPRGTGSSRPAGARRTSPRSAGSRRLSPRSRPGVKAGWESRKQNLWVIRGRRGNQHKQPKKMKPSIRFGDDFRRCGRNRLKGNCRYKSYARRMRRRRRRRRWWWWWRRRWRMRRIFRRNRRRSQFGCPSTSALSPALQTETDYLNLG